MTRQELDHARYLNHRDERLKKQREYYRANKDKYSWRHLSEVYESKQRFHWLQEIATDRYKKNIIDRKKE